MTAGGPMRPGDDWVERVRAASDLVEIVSQTVALKRVGRNMVGLCPFHAEKTPSFSVHPERQFYHCFSCKAGGDVFKFVQETEKVGFIEAVELLSRRAGIPIPERRGPGPSRAPALGALAAAVEAYEQWLADPALGAAARRYLDERGVLAETRRTFRLGLAPAGWEHLVRRLSGRMGDEALIQAGLAGRRDGGRGGLFDRFRNRLMIPLIQAGGDVVGFGARALDPGDEPKYLNSPETAVYHKSSFLFGLDQARRHVEPAGEAVVVEGYFDVIALHQVGVRNVVATSGTALTPDHARILRRMTDRAAVTYDGDAAGQEAVARSLGVLLAAGFHVVVVDLPRGEDPDTMVRRGGVPAWQERRGAALDPIEFLERHVLRGGGDDPREAAVHAVVRLVAQVADPVRMRLLMERASEVFGLGVEVLGRAVSLQRSGQVSAQPVRAAVATQRAQVRDTEAEALQAFLHVPEMLDQVRTKLEPADFLDPLCNRIAVWLWDGGVGAPDDETAAATVRDWLLAPSDDFNWAKVARDHVRKMHLRSLTRRRKEATEKSRKATTATEQDLWLARAQALANEISEIERSRRESDRDLAGANREEQGA